MNGWRSTWALFRVETLLFLREPFAVFFSLAFPLILLLFVGSIGGTEELPAGGRFIDAYMATMIGVTAANVGLMGMSIHIAENRGQGVLKRYRLSPVRSSASRSFAQRRSSSQSRSSHWQWLPWLFTDRLRMPTGRCC